MSTRAFTTNYSMDDIIRLHCRVAELETLLRLRDEQLTEARAANAYLLTTASNLGRLTQHYSQASTHILQQRPIVGKSHLGSACDGPACLHRSKPALTTQHGSEVQPAKLRRQDSSITPCVLPLSPALTDEFSDKPQSRDEVDLLDFDDARDPVSTTATFVSQSRDPKFFHSRRDDPKAAAERIAEIDYDSVKARPILHADGTTSFVVLPSTQHSHTEPTATAYSSFDTNPPGKIRFANHEHSRLMGAACFIEAMSAEERLQLWEDYSKKRGGRHSAEEWRAYYEDEVRPLYLSKVKGRSIKVDYDQECATDNELSKACEIDPEGQDPLEEDETGEVEIGHKAVEGVVARFTPSEDDLTHPKSAAICDGPLGAAVIPEDSKQPSLHTSTPKAGDNTIQSQPAEACKAVDLDPEIQLELVEDSPTLDTSKARPGPNLVTMATLPFPAALVSHQRRNDGLPHELSDLWQYRARFHPEDHKHLFRTVIISGIPSNVTMAEVLDKVRGGTIIHADMIETSLMKTKPTMHTNIARVTFLGASRAQDFVTHCRTNWVKFWSEQWQAPFRATVEMHPFPSTCIPTSFVRDIHQFGMTRILFVHDKGKWTPEDLVEQMITDGAGKHQVCKRPLRARRDEDGVLVLEFASVADAANAWQVIDRNGFVFEGVSKGFFPDPCERPLEKLESGSHCAGLLSVHESSTDSKSDVESEDFEAADAGSGSEEIGVASGLDKEGFDVTSAETINAKTPALRI